MASTSILATRVQRRAPRHILTHSSVLEPSVYNIMCRDGGRPGMRARKHWRFSASATTAFFPLINVVLIEICGSFHGGRVGSTRRSASSCLTPVCRHRALSLTETGRWTAVWRWWCCQTILLPALPRGAFGAVFITTVFQWWYIGLNLHPCHTSAAQGPKTHSHTFILQNIQPPQCWYRPRPHTMVNHSLNENELRTCTPLIQIFCLFPMKYLGGI